MREEDEDDEGDEDSEDTEPKRPLDPVQQEALESVLLGKNVFLTGSAGTGKTRTLRAIISSLKLKYGDEFPQKVAVTASTGKAAMLIDGSTLHSALGLGIPKRRDQFRRIPEKKVAFLDVLVLDEASMISGEFFDCLEQQVKRLRKNDKAFGGLQIILVGDLFQLPPIVKRLPPAEKAEAEFKGLFQNNGMIFQSNAWWSLDLRVVELKTPYRQKDDKTLWANFEVLRESPSLEEVSDACDWLNKKCLRPLPSTEPHVTLLSTVAAAEAVNKNRLTSLPGRLTNLLASDSIKIYEGDTIGSTEKAKRKKKLQGSQFFDEGTSMSPVQKDLQLKIGALVMLLKNLDTSIGLVNGATGIVKDFSPDAVWVHFNDMGREIKIPISRFAYTLPGVGTCTRKQYPLVLAWAMTHHKSQGATLNKLKVDASSFSYGQAYTAISRATTVDGLELLKRLSPEDFTVNPVVTSFMAHARSGTSMSPKLPPFGTWRSPEDVAGDVAAFDRRAAMRLPVPPDNNGMTRMWARSPAKAAAPLEVDPPPKNGVVKKAPKVRKQIAQSEDEGFAAGYAAALAAVRDNPKSRFKNVVSRTSAAVAEESKSKSKNGVSRTSSADHDRLVGFGKHKAITYGELVSEQSGYCRWLLEQERTTNPAFMKVQEYIRGVGLPPAKKP